LNKVCLFGYSGHSYVIVDSLLRLGFEIKGYFNKREVDYNPFDLNYLGFETDSNFLEQVGDAYVFPALGNNSTRQKLIQLFDKNELKQLTIIDPSAIISKHAQIGLSTYVAPKAIVNSLAHIGRGTIINSGAIIEHNVIVKDFCHTAPGTVLCGGVSLGNLSFVGANAVIKENCTIGENSIIGAGAVVIQNVPNNEIWVGCPAKKIES
jgi:sugar O-acyltransferase (sialic acid O-acetyltransferase NeuD family)